MQVSEPDSQWGQTNWNIGVWRTERFIAGPCKEIGGLCPPNIMNSTNQKCKAFLKARWERGVLSCCKLPGVEILCSCSCTQRSGHNVLQTSNKTHVILQGGSKAEDMAEGPGKARSVLLSYGFGKLETMISVCGVGSTCNFFFINYIVNWTFLSFMECLDFQVLRVKRDDNI